VVARHAPICGRSFRPTVDESPLANESEVWLYDLVRETLTRLTFGADRTTFRFGRRTATDRVQFEHRGIAEPVSGNWPTAAVDGSGWQQAGIRSGTVLVGRWATAGLLRNHDVSGYDIWVLRLRDRKAEPFLRTPSTEAAPKFSPDGRLVGVSVE